MSLKGMSRLVMSSIDSAIGYPAKLKEVFNSKGTFVFL